MKVYKLYMGEDTPPRPSDEPEAWDHDLTWGQVGLRVGEAAKASEPGDLLNIAVLCEERL